MLPGTAFAYGQTSSGKTFTMNGTENDPGIIHRAVKDVFQNIHMVSTVVCFHIDLDMLRFWEFYFYQFGTLIHPDS